MVPKSIHYIWFGGAELTPLAQRCIASWRKMCPDYEIVRWDETNFDTRENLYCKQAIDARKWAFASDYARLKVLHEYGGIYMDTDVELIKPLDGLLHNKAFSGFERVDAVPTGIMASEKGHPFILRLLGDYSGRRFIKEDGGCDLTTNVDLITAACVDSGLVLDGSLQTVSDFTLYPRDYFCPKDLTTRTLNITENTYAIHHFDGSWLPQSIRRYQIRKERLHDVAPYLPNGLNKALAMFQVCCEEKSLKPFADWRRTHGGK